MYDLTDPTTRGLLAELRTVLDRLDALPPVPNALTRSGEAQQVAEHVALVSLPAHKRFLWDLHRKARNDPRHAALVRTLEHMEAWLLVYEGQTRHLIGLLTLARTTPKEETDHD